MKDIINAIIFTFLFLGVCYVIIASLFLGSYINLHLTQIGGNWLSWTVTILIYIIAFIIFRKFLK
jgi:hypothetical protein